MAEFRSMSLGREKVSSTFLSFCFQVQQRLFLHDAHRRLSTHSGMASSSSDLALKVHDIRSISWFPVEGEFLCISPPCPLAPS